MKTLPSAITASKGGNSERVIFAHVIPEPGDKWQDFFWATRDCNVLKVDEGGFVNSQGKLYEDFEDTSDWTLHEGDSFEANTTQKREGSQSIKINSVNGAAAGIRRTVSWDLSDATNFVFWLYVHDDLTKNDYICIYLSSVTDWSKYFAGTITGAHYKKGWNRFVISKSSFGATGGESWDNTMVIFRLRVKALAGENASFSFDDFRVDYRARAKCVIGFDDGQESTYTKAKPIMDANGQVGVSFVITDLIGTSGKLTKAQCETMRDAGWDISNHTKTHQDLTTLGSEDLETEVNGAYDWLVSNGFGDSAIFLSYPYGAYNDTVIAKVKENHKTARATHRADFQAHFIYDDDDIDMILKCLTVNASISVATVQDWIDKKIEQGGFLILNFHEIVDSGATGDQVLTADFETISDYLKTKQDAGDIYVITMSDYYRKEYDGSVLAERAFSPISQSVDIEEGGNVAKVSDMTLRVRNPEFSGLNRFDQSFGLNNMENRTVEIWLGFYTGSDFGEGDLLLLFRGAVNDVSFDYGEYQIKVKDAGFKRHKEIPDLIITEEDYPRAPHKNLGKAATLVYGQISGGYTYLSSRFAPPIMLIDEQKYKWVYSRNKGMSINANYLLLFFSGENSWVEFGPTAGMTITYGRPTTIEFASLGQNVMGKCYSQLRGQGTHTNPSTLDFSNAVDDSDTSYMTLGANEKLYLKVAMPSGFGRISDESQLMLRVAFGSITGTGSLRYYNPEWDAGTGKISDGITFSDVDANSTKNYVFGNDKTAHGHEDDQSDQANLWNLEEIGVLEFGIEMDAASSAQIKNVALWCGMLLMKGSIEMIVSGTPRARRWYVRPSGYQDVDMLKDKEAFCASGAGTPFGAWIDDAARDNTLNEGDCIYFIYIIEAILRDELGLTSEEIDCASFDDMAGGSGRPRAAPWFFSSVIEKPENSLNIIRNLCRQAGIIYFQDYRNKEKVLSLKKQTASKTIDRTTIGEGKIGPVHFSDLSKVYNEFYVNYGKQWMTGAFLKNRFVNASDHNLSSNTRTGTPNTYTGLCADSQNKYKQTKRLTLDCDSIRVDATAEQLVKWLAEWHCYRKYIVPFETAGLDHIDLELGDQVKIDHTLLPDGVSNDDSFLLFDIRHDLNKDRETFKFMQVPDLLP